MSRQKARFKNAPHYPVLTEEQRRKLSEIKAFSDWMSKRTTTDKIKEAKTNKLWEAAAAAGRRYLIRRLNTLIPLTDSLIHSLNHPSNTLYHPPA